MTADDISPSSGTAVSDDAPDISRSNDERAFKIKAAAFLAGVTGVSILFGFGTTLAAAKKKDPHFFDQGLTGQIVQQEGPDPIRTRSSNGGTAAAAAAAAANSRRTVALHESGASLAIRALGYGTLYAVTGCSLFFYGVWKLMGVNDMKEFRQKVGGWLPSIPRNHPPQGRTEFSGINDLLQYIIDVDAEQKKKEKEETNKDQ